MEELRFFAFEGMADKLQHPSSQEYSGGIEPKPVQEDAGAKQSQGNHDERNTQRMAEPIYRMLMAAGILRDPLTIRAST